MKLYQLVDIMNVFKTLGDVKLPFNVSYKISKFMTTYQADFEFFHKSVKQLIDTYGEKDENNQLVIENENAKIRPDKVEDFNKELNILSDTELISHSLLQFSFNDFEKLELTLNQVLALSVLFEQ